MKQTAYSFGVFVEGRQIAAAIVVEIFGAKKRGIRVNEEIIGVVDCSIAEMKQVRKYPGKAQGRLSLPISKIRWA